MTSALLLLAPLVLAQAGAAPPPPPAPQDPASALGGIAEGQQIAAQQRAEMQAQLDGIGEELAGVNERLAEQRQAREAAAQAQAEIAQGLDRAYASLLEAATDLAYGYGDSAPALLDRAGQALAAADLRGGESWIAAAQDALDRGDLYQARVAIGRALRTIAPGAPGMVGYGY